MNFQQILATVADDFSAVDHYILNHLDSRVPLVMQVGHYLVEGGGKRLRPLLSLLAARATGYQAASTSRWPPLLKCCIPPH